MNSLLKTLFYTIALIFANQSNAQQIQSINIGVNGLHCSACSFSVEQSLKKLNFVEGVIMDLNGRNAEVMLKKDIAISYTKLAKAVTDAGFSVRHVFLRLKNDVSIDGECLEDSTATFCIVEKKESANKKDPFLQLMGKPFLARKEYKIWKSEVHKTCDSCNNEEGFYFAILRN